uniref:Putative neural cell adhesion molecule l1 n=1 Tax=Aedes aegypti TaxID=7159 RepID=A0A0N8ES29_AEDAE
MECKLISRYSPLLVLFLASLVNAQTGRKRDTSNVYEVIYYGNSQVSVGDPFSISCIASITDPIDWLKDGEPIRKHSQIRHGKDEHSYIVSEMGVAGMRNKIEATISVQHALPKHQGRYQCNSRHKSYHMLYIVGNASSAGSGGSATGHGRTSVKSSSDQIMDTPDASLIEPLLLTTLRPTLITSVSSSHNQLTTPGTFISPNAHPISTEFDKQHSQHRHHQQQSHHHHSQSDKSTKSDDDKQKSQHTFKADSVRFMNKNQEQSTTKDTLALPDDERYDEDNLRDKTNKDIKEDEYPDTTGANEDRNGNDNDDIVDKEEDAGKAIVILNEDRYPTSGEANPLDAIAGENKESISAVDNARVGSERDDETIDEDTSEGEIIVIEKDLSIEDNIDKLILNKSEINGMIRVDSDEDLHHHHSHKKLDHIRNEHTLIHVPVEALPTSLTTALMIVPTTVPTTSTTLPPSTATFSTAGTMTTIKLHGHGGEGHHHHHHRNHEQQQQHASVAVSDILHPNYDDPSSSLKYYDIAKAMTLGCNITKEGDYELSWSKDGENVSEIDSLRDRYKIIKEERKFIISRALESDAGSYTCSVRALNASRTFNVVANVIVKFESTEIGKTNMVEGEKLSLHCVAFGTNPKITWTVGNATLSTSTGRIVLEEDDKGVENARLTIESVLLSDYTDYTCEARNNATDITGKPAQVTITVRIRGKYAALYVFLGIIAEVVVLCAIILICEKRRNKTEIEESDTDNSPDQRRRKSSRNYN